MLTCEASPILLGVGYIIGPRIASVTFAGGVLAYLVLAPAIVAVRQGRPAPIFPSTKIIGSDRSGQPEGGSALEGDPQLLHPLYWSRGGRGGRGDQPLAGVADDPGLAQVGPGRSGAVGRRIEVNRPDRA